MRWMHTQEFNVFEKGCADILGWLQWHWNVPSMYRNHNALNQAGNVVMSSAAYGRMDIFSTSTLRVQDSIKPALCWHIPGMFNKFDFEKGMYDSKDFTNMINMTSVRDYVTVVAISSFRSGTTVLAKLATNNNYSLTMENWMRLKP
jgi:hypothetical protein